jgi:catechol 2,3-dioxygenase-like lactoylglutathione lyase family enzyme
MNLNQITIPSRDVVRAIDFYKKLGLKLIVHTHDAYARFECPDGDSTFSIHQTDKLPTAAGIVIYFEVADVSKTVVELIEKGIQIDEMPKERVWLWTEASLKDLDGNRIIIYQAGENRKNPPWRIN